MAKLETRFAGVTMKNPVGVAPLAVPSVTAHVPHSQVLRSNRSIFQIDIRVPSGYRN